MNSKSPLPIAIFGFLFCTLIAAAPLRAQQQQQGHQRFPAVGPQRVARGNDRTQATAPGRPVVPAVPSWMPLNPEHERYLDQVLLFWEHKSNQTKRYRCAFKRWEYDPVFGPQDTFKTYSEGVIKYSAPDKGLFRVDKLQQYRLVEGKVQYVPAAEGSGEQWICDGQSIYEFDQTRKKLVQHDLPPEARGKAIGKGPLPFLFNAQAADIKRRFWIHIVTPPDTKNEYWLEAVPRTQEDAANFKMAHVIIDAKDYLPKAMVLFDGKERTSFQFNERDVNFSILGEKLNIFHREFYEPSLKKGWTKEVIGPGQPVMPPQGAATARGGTTTRR